MVAGHGPLLPDPILRNFNIIAHDKTTVYNPFEEGEHFFGTWIKYSSVSSLVCKMV